MPQPREGEDREDFVSRCVPVVIGDGAAESPEQAVAICHRYWEAAQEEKSMLSLEEYLVEEIKAATEEEKEAQKKRAKKYGIAVKEKGHVTKPSKYADVPEGSFGDPVNWKFPADAEHAQPALSYFNHEDMREKAGYSSKEWGIMGKRLAKLISRHLDGSYEYRDGKLQKKEEKAMPNLEIHVSDCVCGECTEVDFGGQKVLRIALQEETIPAYGDDFLKPSQMGGIVPVDYGNNQQHPLASGYVIAPATASSSISSNDSGTTLDITIVGDPTPPPLEQKDDVDLAEMKSLDLTRAIKLVDETPEHFLVGGYGHVWGNKQLKDLAGDYFTPDTDLLPELVPTKLAFYDHTLNQAPDGTKMDDPIGVAPEELSRIDDVGKWIQAQIDKRAKWVDAVMELIERGILAWSSGAVPHLVKRAKDGWLERWPVAEYTATPTPCEPRSTDISRLKTAYAAAGLKWLPDNFEPENLGTVSDDDLVTRLAVEREKLRLLSSWEG